MRILKNGNPTGVNFQNSLKKCSFNVMQTNSAVQIYFPEKETGQPNFNQTVRYVFQHIPFAISEDEANIIITLFAEKWDELHGQNVEIAQLKKAVFESCRTQFIVFLSAEKIGAIVDLIIAYLRSIGQF